MEYEQSANIYGYPANALELEIAAMKRKISDMFMDKYPVPFCFVRSGILLKLFCLCMLATGLRLSAGVSVDTYGWTVVTPSEDSRIVYVSNSEGDNANDGLSPQTPKKTIRAGDLLIRNGYPDHLLLKRGDVFPVESVSLLQRWKNGRSAEEPVVLSWYGDSGPRPVIKINNELINHDGDTRNYQAFIGIEVYRALSDPESPDFNNTSGTAGMRFVGGGNDIIIEDCRLRFIQITVQGFGVRSYSNPKIRRNIILDVWAHGTSTGRNERSGIYMSGVSNSYLLEENFFDHNGWNESVPDAGANAYNHNVYIQYENVAGGIMRGNIFARGSSHGMQARSGGVVERNLFVLNAVSLSMGASPASDPDFDNRAVQNVVLSGRRMDPASSSEPQTAAIHGITAGVDHVRIEDNIVANRRDNGVNQAFVANTGSGGSYTLVDNIVYKWDPAHDSVQTSWLHPDHDLGDFSESIGGANDTVAHLNWLRSRPLRTLPWSMTAYAAINYIREGFNKDEVSGYYAYTEESIMPGQWTQRACFPGDVYGGQTPWVYSDLCQDWLYLQEQSNCEILGGGWAWGYLPEPLRPLTATGMSGWFYSDVLETWIHAPQYDAGGNDRQWFFYCLYADVDTTPDDEEEEEETLVNVALHKQISADSDHNLSAGAGAAVDGIQEPANNTRWVSAATAWPHWLEIDLGDFYSIQQIRFWTGGNNAYGNPIQYVFQYRNREQWTDIIEDTANTSPVVDASFPAVTARHVRLYGIGGADNLMRIFEIEIYGSEP